MLLRRDHSIPERRCSQHVEVAAMDPVGAIGVEAQASGESSQIGRFLQRERPVVECRIDGFQITQIVRV